MGALIREPLRPDLKLSELSEGQWNVLFEHIVSIANRRSDAPAPEVDPVRASFFEHTRLPASAVSRTTAVPSVGDEGEHRFTAWPEPSFSWRA